MTLNQLGRRYIVVEGQQFSDLPEIEQQIIQHYTEKYQIPYYRRIMKIINENYHLLYKSRIPSSYNIFLSHAVGWELINSQFKQGIKLDYDYLSVNNFPIKFKDYINNTLTVLQNKRDVLVDDIISS